MKGKTKHPLYRTWANMIARCEIPGAGGYKNYGGRGISVCASWRNSFDAFVEDMGLKPDPHLTIDRIDNDGNYEPDNCRWATLAEQARNNRSPRYIEINGELKHVAEVAEETGINMRTLYYRSLKGMSPEQILSKEKLWNNSESQAKATKVHAENKRAQTHCKHGHLFSEENIYLYEGRRHCRACRRATDRYLYYKKKRPLSDFL